GSFCRRWRKAAIISPRCPWPCLVADEGSAAPPSIFAPSSSKLKAGWPISDSGFEVAGCSLQRLEVDVLELHAIVVALEADVPLWPRDAGVLLAVLGDVIVEVGVHQHLAVVLDADVAALGDDLHRVPLADVLVGDFLG